MPKQWQLHIINRQLSKKRSQLNKEIKKKSVNFKNTINLNEKTIYSQNGEDGIIMFILDTIGITNKTFIEIGIGDGTENNSANLIINEAWKGVLIDRVPEYLNLAKYYYTEKLKLDNSKIKFSLQNATRESIDKTLVTLGITGEIDLLSIDIDGNDYWIWEAITTVKPRIVVIEYNGRFSETSSISTIYAPESYTGNKHESNLYHGASLTTLTKLAHKKGYNLVACESSGTNAFYVLKEISQGLLPSLTPLEAFFPNQTLTF